MSDIITEFIWIDPEEIHLVDKGANGYSPLLAKAAAAVSAAQDDDEDDDRSEDGMVKYVSAEARQKYAQSGIAMPNGDFPIPDKGHLSAAFGRLKNYGGDKAAARRHIIRRAKALGVKLSDKWKVKKTLRMIKMAMDLEQTTENADGKEGPNPMDTSHEAGNPPTFPMKRPDEHDGQGDTSPDKSIPKAKAVSQTKKIRKGKGKSIEMANDQGGTKNDKNSTPGSPEWEDKDVKLAEEAAKHLSAAMDCVNQFASREKVEAKKGIEVALKSLVQKEIEDMTSEELLKMMDERDEAKKASKKGKMAARKAKKDGKKAKMMAKAAADPEWATRHAEKVAKKAAKSAGKKTKGLEVALKAAIEPIAKRLDAVEGTAVRGTVVQNTAGMNAGAQAPVSRDVDGGSVFKSLEDKIANARTPQERARLNHDLLVAKSVAAERSRAGDSRLQGVPVSLLAQPAAAVANAMADR